MEATSTVGDNERVTSKTVQQCVKKSKMCMKFKLLDKYSEKQLADKVARCRKAKQLGSV